MADDDYSLGSFQLLRRLGQGGMAEVWRASHRAFGEDVAVKVMLAEASASPSLRHGFVAEARSHAGLDHPNIVRLLDYGQASGQDAPPPAVGEGDPYLVMELADATVRDQLLPTSWSEARAILDDVLEGLAYSHARGFIHRDLKPENVLRFGEEDPLYKLADFGIAHSVKLDATADRDTLSVTVGTPHYMAPEQFRGQWFEFGPATDLYALGCLAFELVTGRVPFSQSNLVALATAHLSAPVPAVAARFAVPAGLEGWIGRLLQKQPQARFQFARDAAHALAELSDGFTSAGEPTQPTSHPAPDLALDGATTIIDALTDLAMGETLDAIEVDVAGHDDAVALSPPAPAPFPVSWDRDRTSGAPQFGLGLFALRETSVVGLEAIRDRLWSRLGEVRESGSPRLIVLRGDESAPVTELGEWLALRAHEEAAAAAHRALYTRAGGPREGLVGMLEDVLSTWGMRDEEAELRVDTVVRRRVAPELVASCVEVLSTELLRARGVPLQGRRVPSRAERQRALMALTQPSNERPSLLWVRDGQWGAEALHLITRILDDSQPWLVIVGQRGEPTDSHSRRQFEELLEHGAAEVVDVPRYTAEEQELLVDTMLPMTTDARSAVLTPARGDAVALRLLLAALVDREELIGSAEGFELAEDAVLPTNHEGIFSDCVVSFVAAHHRFAGPLEVAALLGRVPDSGELAAVCDRLGVDWTGIGSALVDAGLARASADRWWFIHDAVVEVLQRTARAAGRWAGLNRVCADVLLERATAPEALARAAEHFVAGGAPELALDPLFRAASELLTEDLPRARAHAERHQELLATLGLAPEHPAHVDGATLRIGILRGEGHPAEALVLARQTRDQAHRAGYRAGEGRAVRHLARLAAAAGDLDDAIGFFEDASRLAADPRNPEDLAACWLGLGTAYRRAAHHAESIEAFEKAARYAVEAGDVVSEVLAMAHRASVLAAEGRLPEAEDVAAEAVARGLAVGGVLAATVVSAEVARLCGHYAEARERYTEARRVYLLASPLNAQIMELNLALLDLAEGRFDTEKLEELAAAFDLMGWSLTIAVTQAGLAVCAAAQGDLATVEKCLGALLDALGPEGAESDVIWTLRLTSPAAPAAAREAIGRTIAELERRMTAAL